ncbi:MAG: hypothetical protein ACLGHN_13685 [Bacteriovoracia bacterium]
MKVLLLLSLLAFISCTHPKGKKLASSRAFSSIADGKVQATAIKKVDKQSVCFHINVVMKDVEQKDAFPSNWTAVWIDHKSRHYFLSLNHRDPASIPQEASEKEWMSTFKTCTPRANMKKIKAIILTPKYLPYDRNQGLKLEWN